MAHLIAIDQGTTSSRAIVFDTESNKKYVAQEEYPQHFPSNGWVEHNPEDIWNTTLSTLQKAVAESGTNEISAVGITNQRETTVIWDRVTGKPIYNAIVWQDRRTADFCEQLKQQGFEDTIQKKTGLLVDPYFSASKIRWILDNIDGAKAKAKKGELAFGTIDCFLLWRLTAGKVHKTDATNASRTSIFNIHTQQWDDELLKIFGIPENLLPEVCDNAHDFGTIDSELLEGNIPISAMIGDQQGALVGQACFKAGMAKSTYGTGCFMVLNTGDQALVSNYKLLTTIGYRINGKVTFALEGSIFIAGAAIQWLRDGLNIIDDAKETESIAKSISNDHGVVIVPAFTGLGAPYWDPDARGAIFGITRDTGIEEFVSAGLQSVCYQTKDLQNAMNSDGQLITTLRVDGGMSANNWLMQFLADMLNAEIDRPKTIETTALGVAQLAGLQVGVYSSLEEIAQSWQQDKSFIPEWDKNIRERFYGRWQQAVEKVKTKQ